MNLKKKEKERLMEALGFVYIKESVAKIGTNNPLPCKIEKFRKNETPIRIKRVKSFRICRFLVSNIDFEKFLPYHHRPASSDRDLDPVTDITYGEALLYAEYLSSKHGIRFDLPREDEWTLAAAPFGWEFVYHKELFPNPTKSHFFSTNNYHTLEVNDAQLGTNKEGLFTMGLNVIEMTKGIYKARGHKGALIDGSYYMGKGGGFGYCKMASGGVHRRMIIDIATRSTRIGFRLVSRERI